MESGTTCLLKHLGRFGVSGRLGGGMQEENALNENQAPVLLRLKRPR